jgi:hypothetical protein
MANFNELLNEIKAGIGELATKEAKDFVSETKADGDAFLKEIAADLRRWTDLVARKKLTTDEFEFLLGAKRDLAKMKALTKRGLAKARIDRIVDGVLGIVVDSVAKLL